MKCPTDEQQCEWPNCIFEGSNDFNSVCRERYNAEKIKKTCCLIKPDAYPRFASEILGRLLHSGFDIVYGGTFTFDPSMVDKFYVEHIGRQYYSNLVAAMTAGKTLGLVLSRYDAINRLRDMMGPSAISARKRGEIRYEYGDPEDTAKNCIHGSDSIKSAFREIALLNEFLRR